MSFEWLAVGVLCVWRLTHLLAAEEGPWQSMARLRAAFGAGFWSELLDCFYCLSLWVSLPLALLIGSNWPERVILWPALSAGAILVERVTARSPESAAAAYLEDEDDKDGMLR